jgi:hypothetical protein
MTIQLKPCPFCHGRADFVMLRRERYCHVVQCTKCEAVAGGSAFKNDEYNARIWNTRHDENLSVPPATMKTAGIATVTGEMIAAGAGIFKDCATPRSVEVMLSEIFNAMLHKSPLIRLDAPVAPGDFGWRVYRHEHGHINIEQTKDGKTTWSSGFSRSDSGLGFWLYLYFDDFLTRSALADEV